jgi:hypothetical protein
MVTGRIVDKDVDFFKACRNRLPNAAMTSVDGVAIAAAGLRRDERRLHDADGPYRRQQKRVRLGRGLGLARAIGILFEGTRIDLDETHGRFLLGYGPAWPSFFVFFSKTFLRGRIAVRAGQGPAKPGEASPLTRSAGMRHAGFFFLLFALLNRRHNDDVLDMEAFAAVPNALSD